MDLLRECGCVIHPSLLDGTNYGYWKARMGPFIKSMDELAWKAVLAYWTPPMEKDESGKDVPKSEVDCSAEEDKRSSNNWKTLNAIFNGVIPT